MRSAYLVAYDICNDKRLRRVYETMRGFGDPVQYSVFYCELSAVERQMLKEDLWSTLDLEHDRVMLVHLGPIGGQAEDRIEFWGKPRVFPSQRSATIV